MKRPGDILIAAGLALVTFALIILLVGALSR
jgi:hypothetical protein